MTIEEYRQQALPGTRAKESNANRGASFEAMLQNAHSEYKAQHRAFVFKAPVEWIYCGQKDYEYLSRQMTDLAARTVTGRFIKKKKSAIDFLGVAGSRFVAFDAKQFKGKSFPFANVERHQIEQIRQIGLCGGISGLMLYFSDLNRVFFVPASTVDRLYTEMLVRRGRKSISLAQCEREAVEIPVRNRMVDWLDVLLKNFSVR